MNEITIDIKGLIGDAYGVEAEDGQTVFQHIDKAFKDGKKIILSFQNIEILTTAFLNTAVGQLYKDYQGQFIKEHLSVSDISVSGKIALKRVVDTAKLFYKDPEALARTIDQILEN